MRARVEGAEEMSSTDAVVTLHKLLFHIESSSDIIVGVEPVSCSPSANRVAVPVIMSPKLMATDKLMEMSMWEVAPKITYHVPAPPAPTGEVWSEFAMHRVSDVIASIVTNNSGALMEGGEDHVRQKREALGQLADMGIVGAEGPPWALTQKGCESVEQGQLVGNRQQVFSRASCKNADITLEEMTHYELWKELKFEGWVAKLVTDRRLEKPTAYIKGNDKVWYHTQDDVPHRWHQHQQKHQHHLQR